MKFRQHVAQVVDGEEGRLVVVGDDQGKVLQRPRWIGANELCGSFGEAAQDQQRIGLLLRHDPRLPQVRPSGDRVPRLARQHGRQPVRHRRDPRDLRLADAREQAAEPSGRLIWRAEPAIHHCPHGVDHGPVVRRVRQPQPVLRSLQDVAGLGEAVGRQIELGQGDERVADGRRSGLRQHGVVEKTRINVSASS